MSVSVRKASRKARKQTRTFQTPTRRARFILVVLTGLVALVCLLLWISQQEERRLREAQRLRDRLNRRGGQSLSREEQARDLARLRQVLGSLSPAERGVLHAEIKQDNQHRIAAFFRLSREEQAAYLDRKIDEMEKVLQASRQRHHAAATPVLKAGALPPSLPSYAQIPQTNVPATGTAFPKDSHAALSGRRGEDPTGSQTALTGRRGEEAPRPLLDRSAGQKLFLDMTTPQERIQLEAYLAALSARRVQRGLLPLSHAGHP